MIILDTNVISEIMRPVPESHVIRWLQEQPLKQVFTTVIAEAELLKGIELMPSGKRRDALLQAVEQYLMLDMGNRILPFDRAAARWFAIIFTQRKAKGRPITPLDTQIAAIARSHDAILATRNTRDFEGCGIHLMNPWDTA
jgi:predicted nucleic acid-binding protein